jgi:hypothetical protein
MQTIELSVIQLTELLTEAKSNTSSVSEMVNRLFWAITETPNGYRINEQSWYFDTDIEGLKFIFGVDPLQFGSIDEYVYHCNELWINFSEYDRVSKYILLTKLNK